MSPSRFIELTATDGDPILVRVDSIKTVEAGQNCTIVFTNHALYVKQSPQEVMDAVNVRLDRIAEREKNPHGTKPIYMPTGVLAAVDRLFPAGETVSFYAPTFTWQDMGSHVIVRRAPSDNLPRPDFDP